MLLKNSTLVICALFSVTFSLNVQALPQDTNSENRRSWNFTAYLDDMEIGNQKFEVITRGDTVEVNTEAEFEVRFMFIPFYNYEHKNKEIWNKECLIQLKSETYDDGKKLFVELSSENSKTYIEATKNKFTSNTCVRSFAYWNPDLLKSSVLLNSQTGEFINITYKVHGLENISVNNQLVETRKIQLLGKDKNGKKLDISLWYSLDNEWLSLESRLDDSRSLRYQLKQGVLE